MGRGHGGSASYNKRKPSGIQTSSKMAMSKIGEIEAKHGVLGDDGTGENRITAPVDEYNVAQAMRQPGINDGGQSPDAAAMERSGAVSNNQGASRAQDVIASDAGAERMNPPVLEDSPGVVARSSDDRYGELPSSAVVSDVGGRTLGERVRASGIGSSSRMVSGNQPISQPANTVSEDSLKKKVSIVFADLAGLGFDQAAWNEAKQAATVHAAPQLGQTPDVFEPDVARHIMAEYYKRHPKTRTSASVEQLVQQLKQPLAATKDSMGQVINALIVDSTGNIDNSMDWDTEIKPEIAAAMEDLKHSKQSAIDTTLEYDDLPFLHADDEAKLVNQIVKAKVEELRADGKGGFQDKPYYYSRKKFNDIQVAEKKKAEKYVKDIALDLKRAREDQVNSLRDVVKVAEQPKVVTLATLNSYRDIDQYRSTRFPKPSSLVAAILKKAAALNAAKPGSGVEITAEDPKYGEFYDAQESKYGKRIAETMYQGAIDQARILVAEGKLRDQETVRLDFPEGWRVRNDNGVIRVYARVTARIDLLGGEASPRVLPDSRGNPTNRPIGSNPLAIDPHNPDEDGIHYHYRAEAEPPASTVFASCWRDNASKTVISDHQFIHLTDKLKKVLDRALEGHATSGVRLRLAPMWRGAVGSRRGSDQALVADVDMECEVYSYEHMSTLKYNRPAVNFMPPGEPMPFGFEVGDGAGDGADAYKWVPERHFVNRQRNPVAPFSRGVSRDGKRYVHRHHARGVYFEDTNPDPTVLSNKVKQFAGHNRSRTVLKPYLERRRLFQGDQVVV